MAIAIALVFPADFDAVDRLRIKAHELEDFIGLDRAVLVKVRRARRLGARIETTALEALGIGHIEIILGVRLPGKRGGRREIIPGIGAGEVRRRGDRNASTTEEFGEAVDIGPAQNGRSPLVLGITAAECQRELISEVIGEVGKDRPGLGVDITERLGVQARQGDRSAEVFQQHIENRRRIGVEIVIANQAVQTLTGVEQLELFGELLVLVDRRHVEVAGRQVVEVNRRDRGIITVGENIANGPVLVDFPFRRQGKTIAFNVLLDHIQAGAGVMDIVQNRSTRQGTRGQAVAAAGVRCIRDAVIGEAHEEAVGRLPFGGHAVAEDILVVILFAGVQVLAIAVARETPERAADTEGVGERCAPGQHRIKLAIAAKAQTS